MKAPLGSSPSKQNQSKKQRGDSQQTKEPGPAGGHAGAGDRNGWGLCSQVLLNWKDITNATSLPDGSREC